MTPARKSIFTSKFARGVIGSPVMDRFGRIGTVLAGTETDGRMQFIIGFKQPPGELGQDGLYRETVAENTCKIWRNSYLTNNQQGN
jgi:hypothetical protein